MIKKILSWFVSAQEKPIFAAGLARSSKWKSLRDKVVEEVGHCEACGETRILTAHHIKPFHLYPKLELERDNLIVMCNDGKSGCHFIFGHLKCFKNINPHVIEDSKLYLSRREKT